MYFYIYIPIYGLLVFPFLHSFLFFWGSLSTLFPPSKHCVATRTDLTSSLFQTVIQGNSRQKDEGSFRMIFHREHCLLYVHSATKTLRSLLPLITWQHKGCDSVSQKSSGSLGHDPHHSGKVLRYRSIQSPSKSVGFFLVDKPILKSIWKAQGIRTAKIIF